jgi:peptidoglycan hydrolase CwlO-like protein
MNWSEIIIAIFASGVLSTVISSLFSRKKEKADIEGTMIDNANKLVDTVQNHYQQLIDGQATIISGQTTQLEELKQQRDAIKDQNEILKRERDELKKQVGENTKAIECMKQEFDRMIKIICTNMECSNRQNDQTINCPYINNQNPDKNENHD